MTWLCFRDSSCVLTYGQFFMAWTLAASEHDNERAIKRFVLFFDRACNSYPSSLTLARLKTRETFVQRAEESLELKKKHCE